MLDEALETASSDRMTATIKAGLEVRMRGMMCGRNCGLAVATLAEFALSLGCIAPCSVAQNADLSPTVQAYVRVKAGKVVLTHVRVIDGTGAPAVEDRNITIENGKIAAIEAGADLRETDVPGAPGIAVIDL